jgi:hypothetical protein
MKRILKRWYEKYIQPEYVEIRVPYKVEVPVMVEKVIEKTVDRIVVLDHTPMTPEEYVFAFNMDNNHPFVKAICQLCDTMKNDYMITACDVTVRPETKLDSIARISAIDEFKRELIAQMTSSREEVKRRNK